MLVVQPQPQQNNLMHFQESAMYMSPEPANPNQICRYWSQKGSCPNKHCPYSNTHTARNSPRYAKHMPAQQQPREGALEIKDPSQIEPSPRIHALEIKDAPQERSRPHALEIKDAPSSVQDTAPSLPVSNQNNNQQSQSVTNEKVVPVAVEQSQEQPRSRGSRFAHLFGK